MDFLFYQPSFSDLTKPGQAGKIATKAQRHEAELFAKIYLCKTVKQSNSSC
jgi:hypothetical protein